MSLTNELIALRDQFRGGREAQQAQLLTDLMRMLQSAQWESILESSEELAITLNELVDSCTPTLGAHLKGALEIAVKRYCSSQKTTPLGLTCIHTALAVHSRKHRYMTGDHLAHLELFSSESSDLPALSVEHDVASYFESCAAIFSHNGDWKTASIHAALAASLGPSLERVRISVLTELIANGYSSGFPRAVWSNLACPVVAQFSQFFSEKTLRSWEQLAVFFDENADTFRSFELEDHARRALATFCIQLTVTLMERVTMAPVQAILGPFLDRGLALNDLLNAGLNEVCEFREDLILYREPRDGANSDDVWLQEVVGLAASLQGEL